MDVVYLNPTICRMMNDKLPKSKVTGNPKWFPEYIALPHVKIVFTDSNQKSMKLAVEYHAETGTVHAYGYKDDTKERLFACDYVAKRNDEVDGYIDLQIENKRFPSAAERDWFKIVVDEETHSTNATTIYENYLIMNNYICYYGLENTFNVEEKVAKHHAHKTHRKNNKKPVVRLYKCYTLRTDWEKAKRSSKPIYTCSAWGVRGHFRKTPSGGRTFVRAYVKGKDRDKYVGKEYKLAPSVGM